MMKYVRDEREGDFSRHLEAFTEMLPYNFASGHARYGLVYVRYMEALSSNISKHFEKGEYVR